jgi:hypothetical protein
MPLLLIRVRYARRVPNAFEAVSVCPPQASFFVRHSLPSLPVSEETRSSRPGLPNPLAVLRASLSFVDDLPGLSEQLSNSIGELSGLIAEQVSATREQIAASRALKAETAALHQDVRLLRESLDQVRDKVPGL